MTTIQRPDHAIEIERKVSFHHCDPLGVAWHGRYFEWFEEARSELFEAVDLGVEQIRGLGHRMYIVDAKCRYMAPMSFGDSMRITTWFSDVQPLIRVGYDVYNLESKRWAARATTVLATTDITGELLPKTPDAILDRLPSR